jgi:hypothetical protein
VPFARAAALVLTFLVGLYLLAAVLYAVPMIAGLIDSDAKVAFDRADPSLVTSYSNGLTSRQKEDYYHLSQGAEILPWALFTAIDVADPNSTKPFVENLQRYGLMPDPARNDGLAVGLSLSTNSFTSGLEFVGVTCAGCHVGELRHDGKAVRIDGAPNMLNLQLFYSDAIDAFVALKSPAKLWHVSKRLGRQDFERWGVAAPLVRPAILAYAAGNAALHWDKIKARLELIEVIDVAKQNRDPAHPTSGFGRLDAFDGTRNFLLTRLRKEDKNGSFEVNVANLVKLDAPVKFPPLWSRKTTAVTPRDADPDQPDTFPPVWGFKDYDWVEWTIDTDSVLERNVTETLGAGATVVLDPANPAALFDSSIPIANMHRLEWLSYYLDPPQWPAEAFGAVKPDLAAMGETIFKQQCADCHEYADSDRTPSGLIRLRGLELTKVGTDATAALRISCPVPDIGALDIPKKSFTAEQSELLKGCAGVTPGDAFVDNGFAAVVQTVVDGIKRKAFAAAKMSYAQQRNVEDFGRRQAVVWRDTLLDTRPPYGPYAARPLFGIWAAAPYLHNGSVPTLYDLLSPPQQRPKSFPLGHREYDPVKLGFAADVACSGEDCMVDTSLPGSGNGGHVFGTDMSEADRMALLEYLKTY